MQQRVEGLLSDAFGSEASLLSVTNESHGKIENESHFHVHVVSREFEGVRLVQRHRMVNAALTDDDGKLPFHSLRITALVDDDSGAAAPDAPKCTGGDGLRLR
jgi:BolA protein